MKRNIERPKSSRGLSSYVETEIYPVSEQIARIRRFGYDDRCEIRQRGVVDWYCNYHLKRGMTACDDKRLTGRITVNICNRYVSGKKEFSCDWIDDSEAYSTDHDLENAFIVAETFMHESENRHLFESFKRQVEKALQSLSIDHKIVFFMKLNGASSKEMAEKIGKSPVHCRNILFHARKALKPIAEEYLLKLNS